MFEILFFFVAAFIVVVFILVIVGSIIQFAMIGSIFGIAMNRMKQQIDAESPKTCPFCNSTIPPRESKCPNCGSSRDSTDA